MYYELSRANEEDEYILFLHGWGGSVASFKFFYNALSKNHNVINIDFPGFGFSPEPSKAYKVADFAEEVLMLVDKLGAKRIIIICHSFGGRVALLINKMRPDIIKKLVLIDIAGIKPRFNLVIYIKKQYYKFLKWLKKLKLVSQKRLDRCGSSDYRALSGIMKKTFVNVVNENLLNYVDLVHCKTLIIWGKNDKDTKLYMAKILHRKINNSTLKVVRGGHFAYVENRFLVLEYINKFLGE